jgi:hypothetical protein
MWTHFYDMHSGGRQKLQWQHIFIEAPQAEAEVIFYNRFGRNPNKITCTCCGEDYSISEHEALAQATGYQRNCAYEGDLKYVERQGESWRPYLTLEEYLKSDLAHFVYAAEVRDSERVGEVPSQGYVWVE